MAAQLQEEVYYGDGRLWITSERVVANGRDYWLKKIKSVGLDVVSPRDRAWLIYPLAVVLIIDFILIRLNYTSLGSLRYEPFLTLQSTLDFAILLCLVLAAAVLVAAPFFILRMPRSQVFALSLYEGNGRFGRHPVLASVDSAYVQGIAAAIEHALAVHARTGGTPAFGSEYSPPPAMPAPPEVRIGPAGIKANDKTYPVSSVKSVRLGAAVVGPFWWAVLLFLPLLTISQLFQYLSKVNTNAFALVGCIGVILVTMLGMVALSIAVFVSVQHTAYMITLRGPFGADLVYASMNNAQAKEIRNAIKHAIRSTSKSRRQPSPSV